MASTWSALKIELLETGANSGTWGTLTNVNLGDAVLGEAITGSATVDFPTDADVTVTLTDSATTQSARNLRLNITESSTGVGSVRSLILGSGCQIEKFYLINNTGTGAKTVKNTTGTGISVPAGKATLVYNNGTNVVDAASYFTSLTLGSALPVASGGTGVTTSTGTTNVVLSNSPTLVAPVLGTPASGTVTNLTGTASININGTVGATTATTGAFTSLTASTTLTVTGAGSIQGLTVGLGAGAVSSNTVVGVNALSVNSTGAEITAIGRNALAANTVNYGTAVGFNALTANTTGAANAAFGAYALSTNTTGQANSAFGALGFGLSDSALQANLSGSYNSAFGLGALAKNTTASNNTAVGYQAGYSNTTGIRLVALGTESLFSNTTGTNNVALGHTALRLNTTGSSNIGIGYGAGVNVTTGFANTLVGNDWSGVWGSSGEAITTGNGNSFFGTGSGRVVSTGSKNTILGSYSGNNGGLDIRTSSNYIVLSDGDGNSLVSTADNQTVALEGAVPNSGTGITFPATQSASTNANTLDDYEEGTWTPAQGSGVTVVGAFSSSGTYTKIGRQVTVVFTVAGATTIAVTAGGQITNNLPFTVLTGIDSAGTIYRFGASGGQCIAGSNQTNVFNGDALVAGGGINVSITYFV